MGFKSYYLAEDAETGLRATHEPGSGRVTFTRADGTLVANLGVPTGGRPMTLGEFGRYLDGTHIAAIASGLKRRERAGGLPRGDLVGLDGEPAHVYRRADRPTLNLLAMDVEAHRRLTAGEDPYRR